MAKEIKCVIWDLDNTLWDGTLLESDAVHLKPGIRDIIRQLDERGILQSVASKNNHADAINKLREFELEEYFLYPEINWNSKSSSVRLIQQHLNIGLDTFAFVDDDAFEREEVQSVYPDVLCVDASQYRQLLDMPRFTPAFLTEDSRKRRDMYRQDMLRNAEEKNFEGPQEAFLATLGMKFTIAEALETDLQRAEELTVRTNQLNATGRTYDFDELNYFRTSPDHKLFICELTDKYGSYGKIGLALVQITQTHWHLRLLLMSCRVLSRGVGSVLLSFIMQQAKNQQKQLLADFKKTDRNRMMLVTYRFANFREVSHDGDGLLLLAHDLEHIQPFPPYINIITQSPDLNLSKTQQV